MKQVVLKGMPPNEDIGVPSPFVICSIMRTSLHVDPKLWSQLAPKLSK